LDALLDEMSVTHWDSSWEVLMADYLANLLVEPMVLMSAASLASVTVAL
jgi:hypothetical protein